MKRLPILVVETRPLYQRRHGCIQKAGCDACVMFQGKLCKESTLVPNGSGAACLSSATNQWGGHYEWSQHKISVSRNKREGKFAGKDGRGERHRVGHNTRIVALGGKLGKAHVILERTLFTEYMTAEQAFQAAYPPRERQAKHAQWPVSRRG